jgi:hypothetical protein
MKYPALILAFLFIATPLFPQQDNLTVEQLDEYFDSKINIGVYELREGERHFVEPSPGALNWQAYLGEKMISEKKFFFITGYEYEAKKAMNYRLGSIPLILVSPLPAYAGIRLTAAIIKSYQRTETEPSDEEAGAILLIPIAGIAISVLIFKAGLGRLANNRYQYSKAELIMNEYNERLLREMKEK